MRGVRRRPLTSTGATDFDAFTRADPPQPSGVGAACTVPANPTDNTPAATAAATTFFTRDSFTSGRRQNRSRQRKRFESESIGPSHTGELIASRSTSKHPRS